LHVARQTFSAIVDTGFNGDLELPAVLAGKLNDQPVGRVRSSLAGGQVIQEDAYLSNFHSMAKSFPQSPPLFPTVKF
jgi:predicted aspartyl protease